VRGEQGGERKSGARKGGDKHKNGAMNWGLSHNVACEGSEGSAARYFPNFAFDGELDIAVPFGYFAKASRSEREQGLEGMPVKIAPVSVERHKINYTKGDGEPIERIPRANHHPTCKPVALGKWLTRLITPPGGTVLDPFAGSGSLGVAAVLEGFNWIGIEQELDYFQIAEKRLAWAAEQADKQTTQQLRLAV
jgi:DNA modification methylase